MKRIIAPSILALAPAFAVAQSLTPAEENVLPRLIFSDCIDIHDNIGCETVALLQSETEEGTADLVILPDHRSEAAGTPLVVARGVVFNGPMWGMAPWVEARDGEGFLLLSEQVGMGRQPWGETLTIVWRDGAFVVSGYTFSSYDRILNNTYTCDINLRTGGYVSQVTLLDMETDQDDVIERSGTGPVTNITLQDWSIDRFRTEVCAPEADIYYSQ